MSILRRKLFALFMPLMCGMFYVSAQATTVDYNRLITAIGTVESKLNDNAKNGVHAGFLQISKICVAECNRINKLRGVKQTYTLQDRYNRSKSIEMFRIIQSFYNKDNDLDYAIHLWNKGVTKAKKGKKNMKYHKKVMKIYNN